MPEPLFTSGTEEFSRHSQLFTLRLWREDLGDGQIEWRGKVQHVPSGEVLYFREWSALLAFLLACFQGLEKSYFKFKK